MSLPSKVTGVVDKAVGDVVMADEVNFMPAQKDLFPQKRSTK